MAMATSVSSNVLKRKLDFDVMEDQEEEHKRAAHELALTELSSIEVPFPGFNSIAALSKHDFNILMRNIKKKYANTKVYLIMVAVVTDTLTCMMKHSTFYEEYACENKTSINLMLELLRSARSIITFTEEFDYTQQLPSLISILERSAGRIINCDRYSDLVVIITEMKCIMQQRQNKENKPTKKTKQVPQKGTRAKSSNKILTCTTNTINEMEIEKPEVCLDIKEETITTVNLPIIESTVHAAPVKEIGIQRPKNAFELLMSARILNVKQDKEIEIHKPKNAFEFMMNSSKILSMNQKSSF